MLRVSDGLSDHLTVIFYVNFSRTLVQLKHNVSYRHIHQIDIDIFNADNLKSDLIRDPKGHDLTCVSSTIIYLSLYLINTPL